eukprot:1021637_1
MLEADIVKNATNATKMIDQFKSYTRKQLPHITTWYSNRMELNNDHQKTNEYGAEPNSKRHRGLDGNATNGIYKNHCTFGASCFAFIRFGKCRFYHPPKEYKMLIAAMKQK